MQRQIAQQQITRARVHTAAGKTAYTRHEDEADALAARWMKVIRAHYGGYELACGDPILAVLKILYLKCETEGSKAT